MESLYDGLTGIGVRRERINLRVVRFRDGVNPEVKPAAAARIGHIAMVSCRCGSRNRRLPWRGRAIGARRLNSPKRLDGRWYSAVDPASVEPARPRLSARYRPH